MGPTARDLFSSILLEGVLFSGRPLIVDFAEGTLTRRGLNDLMLGTEPSGGHGEPNLSEKQPETRTEEKLAIQ
jgi:hypothetical protein